MLRLIISFLIAKLAFVLVNTIVSTTRLLVSYLIRHPEEYLYFAAWWFVLVIPFCYSLDTFRMMWHRIVWVVLVELYEQIDVHFTIVFGLVIIYTTALYVNYVLPYNELVMLEVHYRATLNATLYDPTSNMGD